jgi:hypothetical protein
MRLNSWAYCRFYALREWASSSPAPGPDYWNALRSTVVDALREHESKFKRVLESVPFPAEMASFLATALSDLSEGDDHPFFARRVRSGGRGNLRSRQQQECVDGAIDYLIAVDLKLIADRRSRTTVAERFGVTRKQVQRWLVGSGAKARRERGFRERWSRQLKYDHDPKRTVASMVRKVMEFRADDYQHLRRRRTGQ